MTVKELIEELKKCPQDLIVRDTYGCAISGVNILTDSYSDYVEVDSY